MSDLLSAPAGPTVAALRDWRAAARWLARHELWLLAVAGPLLLFPAGAWPWLGLGLLLLGWVARWVGTGRLTLRTPVEIPVVLLLIMVGVGALVSVDPVMSTAKVWGVVLDVAVFFVFLNAAHDEAQAVRLGRLLAGLTLAVAGLALVGTDWQMARMVNPWGLYNYLPSLVRGLPRSGVPVTSDLFHPREVGGTLALLVPLCVALMLGDTGWARRAFAASAAIVGTVVLLLTQTPHAVVGLLVGVFVIAVWRNRWALLAAPLGVGVVGAGVLAYGPQRLARALLTFNNFLGIGVVLRLDIWSRAWAMLRDMPLTGIGINTFPTIQSEFYTGFAIGPEDHAHNFLLQTALDLGVPGLLGLLAILVAFGWVAWRGLRQGRSAPYRALMAGLAGGVLSFLVYGLVDAVTLGAKPSGALWAMLALGLAGATGRRLWWFSTLWPLGALAVLVLWVGMAAPSVLPMNLGAVQAHRALHALSQTDAAVEAQLRGAQPALESAAGLDPTRVHAWSLLGRTAGWLGQPGAGLEALAREVALDGQDPFGEYNPAESWLRQIDGTPAGDRWADALKVYQQWMDRFPARAENYVLAALVWDRYQGDPVKAAAILKIGLNNGAEPRALLENYALALSKR